MGIGGVGWEVGGSVGVDMDFILRNDSVFWDMNDKIAYAIKSLTGRKYEKAQCARFIRIERQE